MSKLAKALTAAAGNAGESLYVEDVFSTYLYEGTGATQSIDNGIDLDGEGGLVWIKQRDDANPHVLFDTERGTLNTLHSNQTSAAEDEANSLTSYNSNGFTLGSFAQTNGTSSSGLYASWTFRKAEKFFDVVTYTGNGTSGRTVAHNLGSVPGCIIIKSTTLGAGWNVYHRGNGANPETKRLLLQSNIATQTVDYFGDTVPTDFVFSLGSDAQTNASGQTYVAYLFASDAGGFGDDGSESIIKCGSYTGNGSTNGPEIDLGFEPQWLMVKNSIASSDWYLVDTMRGFTANTSDSYQRLMANLPNAEDGSNAFSINSTGFKLVNATYNPNVSGNTYIYIAIRRPMKTPESGTEVFATDTRGSTGDGKEPTYRSPFPVDMQFNRNRTYAGGDTTISARLTQANQMFTNLTNAESANAAMMFDYMNGVQTDTGTNTAQSAWMFKRATGFFDVVAYTGDGVAGRTVAHNLGVAPELMIVKQRDASRNWTVYSNSSGAGKYQNLNNVLLALDATSMWNNTSPTANVFTVGDSGNTNASAGTYIAYLFATVAGVSKVGSYTGTGADLNVDCGFSAGARFILIKRTDENGDWYVYDSERGIVAGNDPYLLLNSTAAEVTSTDYIDPLNAGFTVTSSAPAALNASGGTYIFLAIA